MSGKPKEAEIASDEHVADNVEATGDDTGPRPVDVSGESQESADQRQIDPQALADENWDKYLRAVAELENVRKRSQRDIDNARKFALERFAGELLAVRDSLELGLSAADGADVGAFREGCEATLKLLISTMQQFGISEIDPLGEPFDPQLHEAMTMQPSAEAEPGSVLTVFQKGYELNGRLLRPARVVVAAEPDQEG
ncbi:MAG: nucleotide exchange factor GrpE [Gammaproteobacteria bacterium]|nr:nucleotide exchange factor GrpE [Gammaproteobacteria bacterium]MDH4314567.1 nucleotide exchange factor GrpE [Gammaproteobacteria bacterium]MDH5213748.1 nucleotide exchange factor GrpE [Gammaproteobacteria bacterium]MDH5499611.1 nucleotide exchange factor GrpE [Gammaproteobacteria bacterium]